MTSQTFIDSFLGGLARDDFYAGQTFLEYLNTDHGGDEKNIVDLRISKLLIDALGYSDSEYTYDNSVGKRRPDFVVGIAQYPKPCFVIEDKKSKSKELEREALPQLEGYLRSLGAPRGLLCNGRGILAYELHDPVPVLIAQFDLLELVARWRGQGNVFASGTMSLPVAQWASRA
jgi:type I restriction enzyme M protein